MTKKNYQTGFTLIEFLVSLTIFSLLLGNLYYVLGVELRAWQKLTREIEHLQIVNMLIYRMGMDIRAAKVSSGGASELLLGIDSEVRGYTLADRKVRYRVNKFTAYLTTEDEIQKLSFSSNAKLVGISLDDFEALISLRN